MVTGDVLSGDLAKIYMDIADAIGTDFDGTADPAGDKQYQMEVTKFDVSGGETDYDSEAVFGGFIDLKKPQSQYEISMDVILRFGSNSDKWDDIVDGTTPIGMIAIQTGDGDSNFYWNAFNNVRTVNFDKEFAADGEWRGSMTFKLSPKDAEGKDNFRKGVTDFLLDSTAWES